jgi:hypothetical protein
MSQAIKKLYSFGTGCPDQICLGGIGGGNDTIHKTHFNDAANGAGFLMTVFLTDAIGASAANIPIAATTSTAILVQSGEGLPTRKSTSAGPIFAERMQTIGKGNLYLAFNGTNFDYASLRGVPLSGLHTTITHKDVGAPGLGNPAFENDVIEVSTSMHISMTAFTGVMTYGLFEHVDVGVALPLLYTSLSGSSFAQIMPFGPNDPHYFGDSANRSLQATSSASTSATGIGDVAARLKVGLLQRKDWGLAFLGDLRIPTGNQQNSQGSGRWGFQAIGIVSAQFVNFSPHANVGYYFHEGTSQTDAALVTLGFDQLVTNWATLAVDVISQWQVGPSTFHLPPNVTLTSYDTAGVPNTTRTIVPTNIPNQADNVVVGSFGFKFLLKSGITLVTNALVPLLRGGLQPSTAFTLGVDYTI